MIKKELLKKLKKMGMSDKEILAYVQQQQHFNNIKTVKGERGTDSKPEDVASILSKDAKFRESVKGKDANPQDVASLLLSNKAFLKLTKGEKGESIVAKDVANLIKKDKEFISSLRGDSGKDGRDGKDAILPNLNELAINAINVAETFEGDDRFDAKAIKNIEKNIDITKTNTKDLKLDASQITNLPASRTIVKGGSDGFNILSSGVVKKQGANQINFGSNLTVTPTTNGVTIDATGGSSSVSVNTVEVTDPDFTDSAEIEFDATGSTVTASIATGSIDVLKLDAGVQASLALADSALQAANISDTAYDATSWNGVTTIAPSKNAVRDKIESMLTGSGIDHGGLTGLSDDDHTQYALLTGRSGGQTFIGGTGTTDDLIFQTTSGVGATGADMIFRGGNNGATEFMRILNNGNLGTGTGATVSARIHAIATTEQLRVGYDTSNYFSTTVSSAGLVTYNAVGASSAFVFNDKIGVGITPIEKIHAHAATGELSAGLRTSFIDATSYGEWNVTENGSYIGGLAIFGSNYVTANWRSAMVISAVATDVGSTIIRHRTGGVYQERLVLTNGGNLGIGLGNATNPSARFHAISTTEQVRIGYNATNYWSTTVASTGSTTFALTGTSPEFTFSQIVNLSAGLQIGGHDITDILISSDGASTSDTAFVTAGWIDANVTAGSGVSNTYNEVPTGLINSSNTVFTTAAAFNTSTTRVYLNGLRQELGVDYTETDVDEITFTVAPTTGDILVVDYEQA